MSDCSTELQRTVPLRKVVSAAIIDTYEDIGRVQHMYSHWAARGLKKLDRETLKTGFRKAILTVNRSTMTATLPPDFDSELGVYVIVNGKKILLRTDTRLVDQKNIEEIPCEDKCEKCGQDSSICDEMTITEETIIKVIEGNNYNQTIVKKMYPDGSYYLETTIPMWDVTESAVVYTTTKEFITQIDLKPCGCIDETPENIAKIQCCCYDVYCAHFAPCDTACSGDYGSYKIFPETGVIQFNKINFNKCYIEYWGFMPKKNGQYHVPEVAFEALVAWVKLKKIENKPNTPYVDKRWHLERYKSERDDMVKVLCGISLGRLIQITGLIPKFDLTYTDVDYCGTAQSPVDTFRSDSANGSGGSGSGGNGNGDDDDDCGNTGGPLCSLCPPSNSTYIPYSIAEIAGVGIGPVPGTNTFQDNRLINAIGVNYIIVNNTDETIKGLQFTLDTTTGTITRYQADGVTPNDWFGGDVLIVPTFFKLST